MVSSFSQYAHYITYIHQPFGRPVSGSFYISSSIFWEFSGCFDSCFGNLKFSFKRDCDRCDPSASTVISNLHCCVSHENLITWFPVQPFPLFPALFPARPWWLPACFHLSQVCRDCSHLCLHLLPFLPTPALPWPTWLCRSQFQLWHPMFPAFLHMAKVWQCHVTRHLRLAWVMHPSSKICGKITCGDLHGESHCPCFQLGLGYCQLTCLCCRSVEIAAICVYIYHHFFHPQLFLGPSGLVGGSSNHGVACSQLFFTQRKFGSVVQQGICGWPGSRTNQAKLVKKLPAASF